MSGREKIPWARLVERVGSNDPEVIARRVNKKVMTVIRQKVRGVCPHPWWTALEDEWSHVKNELAAPATQLVPTNGGPRPHNGTSRVIYDYDYHYSFKSHLTEADVRELSDAKVEAIMRTIRALRGVQVVPGDDALLTREEGAVSGADEVGGDTPSRSRG